MSESGLSQCTNSYAVKSINIFLYRNEKRKFLPEKLEKDLKALRSSFYKD